MALSVVNRPTPLRLSTSTGVATTSGTTLTDTAHGLVTGDYVYITDNEATGFWYVNKLTNDTFEIKEYPTASSYSFAGTASLTWTEVGSAPYWNAVHNPIVYKLKSTLWPTNSVDTARTVSSYSNDLGYVKLTLSGDIKSDVTELEFVKVTFTGGTTAVYQILTWYSNSIVTINLPYVGGLTFVSVQYYYVDYHAKIRLYAGLVSTHTFATQKPYTEICEIKCVPDSSGVITVNVNEYLKKAIEILSNDLNLGTLPNDINAFCQFYIEYAEAYSYSAGGYTLLDYVGSYTSDAANADLYAINASMPFKNIYSGWMSEYTFIANTYLLKFLTGMTTPYLFADETRTSGQVSQFFDISFIRSWGSTSAVKVKRECYVGSAIVQTYMDSIPDYGVGVYRHEIDRSIFEEDRIDLTVVYTPTLASLSTWTNQGSGIDWSLGATPSVTVTLGNNSKYLTGAFSGLTGASVSFTIDLGGAPFVLYLYLHFLDSGFASLGSTAITTDPQVITTTVPSGTAYIAIRAQDLDLLGPEAVTVNSASLSSTSQLAMSETKTIMVDDSCSNNDSYYDLSWKNHLGGMDYWRFKAFAELGADITKTTEAKKNIYPTWPNSWGAGADTVRYETSRVSNQTIVLRAENLSEDQVADLFKIKLSPLVQIVNSRTDRRTVIPDSGSFTYLKQGEKMYTMQMTIAFTDDFPAQSL